MNDPLKPLLSFLSFFANVLQTPEIYGQLNPAMAPWIKLVFRLLTSIPFNIVALIIAVLVLGAFVALAIFRKKGRVLAILTGITNLLAVLAVPLMSRIYNTLPTREFLDGYYYYVYYNQMSNILVSFFKIVIMALIVAVASGIVFLAFVLSIVYFVTCLKNKPVILPVLAIVVAAFRHIFVSPVQIVVPAVLKLVFRFFGSSEIVDMIIAYISQLTQTALYGLLVLIPALLVLAPILVSLIKSKKQLKAEAVENSTEQKAEETAEQKDDENVEKAKEIKAEKKVEELTE